MKKILFLIGFSVILCIPMATFAQSQSTTNPYEPRMPTKRELRERYLNRQERLSQGLPIYKEGVSPGEVPSLESRIARKLNPQETDNNIFRSKNTSGW